MIRPATENDLPDIIRMGREFVAQLPLKFPFSPERAETIVRGAMADGGVFVADVGPLVGMIGLIAHPHFFCEARAAQEMFWWVEPGHRGSGIAGQLLDTASGWAKERGCQMLNMVCVDELDGKAVAKMYERRGFVPLERSYVRFL
jgi:GNAT superfamily N-acetyltransferase